MSTSNPSEWTDEDRREALASVEPAHERVVAVSAGPSPGPQTHEEARQFHEGYLAGLTVYARESGHSTLKSKNELLRRLMDEQGWKTVEMFETLAKE